MLAGRTARTQIEEELQHLKSAFTDPENAGYTLAELGDAWAEWMEARGLSPESVRKARNVLASFVRSLEARGDSLTLASLHPTAVNRWVKEQRDRDLSEDGIASRLSTLKVFANAFVHNHLELTTDDVLKKVKRLSPPPKPKPRLSDAEVKAIVDAPAPDTFEGVRNRALLYVYASTGRRLREVAEKMTVSGLNKLNGDFTVEGKGGHVFQSRLSPNALKAVKAYLHERPNTEHDALWVTREGRPLTGWGVMIAIRRLKESMGLERLHSHLFRHTFAQRALTTGAGRLEVMDMLGHQTDRAARIYGGHVRQQTAAAMMPKHSPV